MIKLDNITLAFGSRTLIAGGTAHFECGTMTALLGRNGTGKSTLLRAMASLGTVQSGHIEIGGKALHDLSNVELARQLAFVNTERVAVEAMTGYDLVAVGRSPYTDWSGRLKSHDHAMVATFAFFKEVIDYSLEDFFIRSSPYIKEVIHSLIGKLLSPE